VDRLAAEIERHAEAVEQADTAGEAMPEIEPPRVPRT
jgi:hypothetical protein